MKKNAKFLYCATLILVQLTLCESIIRDEEISIAGIFQSPNTYNPSLLGFEDGVRYANTYILRGMKLKPYINHVRNDDSFDAINSVCQLIQTRHVWSIFTAQSLPINWIIPSVANNLQIPHIGSIWDYSNSRKIFDGDMKTNFTINIFPDASLLSQSLRDWLEQSDIKAFTIIYERKEDLIYIKDLLELNSPVNKIAITIKEHIVEGSDFKKLLKDSKMKNSFNFVLAIPVDKVIELIKQADELGLVTEYNKYLITNLDAFSLNYDFLDNNKNITTLSLINVELLKNEPYLKFASEYKHEHALMFDAVTTFAKALSQLKNSAHSIQSPAVNCERTNRVKWKGGQIIMNHIKNTMFEGITGPIEFNENGQRVNFTMRILAIQQYDTTFNQTGFWTVEKGVEIARIKQEDVEEDIKKMLRNRRTPIKVATMVVQPYNFENPIGEDAEHLKDFLNPTQNYTGFCVELLDKLKERTGFEYELMVLNGTSALLLEHVQQQKADLAIADITITKERQLIVDFTMPYLSLGVAILYSKSSAQSKDLFSFMQPFHMKVWLLLGTAILGVSLFMYIISRISPYEWVSGHPCDDEPEEMENQFSLGNCIWFTLGSIMQQGSDLAPRASSTRILANVWAFFTLIMTSSYTANLAAVLTLSGLEVEIKSVEDLARQTKVKYGVQKEGSTYKFFKNSQHSTYQRMFSYMESIEKTEKVYTKGNDEGVGRVLKGGFAYLMESTTLDFFTNQYCNLTQIGNLLDRKGYGIVLKQGSPYTSLLSNAILKLQEEQYLSALRNKWFSEYPAKLRQLRTPHMGECPKIKVASSGAKEMEIIDVGGVFIVLVIGLAIGILFSLAEIWWKAKKIAQHEREPVCTLIWREFYRTLTLGGSTTTDNPLLLTKANSSSNANLSSRPRQSIGVDDEEKTIRSGSKQQQPQQQKDSDSNKVTKEKPRSRSSTGLSKKMTTPNTPQQQSPAYNLPMNTNGLPHRDSAGTGYTLNNNNNNMDNLGEDFTDHLLNDSVEMNNMNRTNNQTNPILQPPPGFDGLFPSQPTTNGQVNNLTNHFEPYIKETNYTPLGVHRHSSSPKPKKRSNRNQQPNSPNNSDLNDNTLRRRSYLTESPIKWPKATSTNNYDDVYE